MHQPKDATDGRTNRPTDPGNEGNNTENNYTLKKYNFRNWKSCLLTKLEILHTTKSSRFTNGRELHGKNFERHYLNCVFATIDRPTSSHIHNHHRPPSTLFDEQSFYVPDCSAFVMHPRALVTIRRLAQ